MSKRLIGFEKAYYGLNGIIENFDLDFLDVRKDFRTVRKNNKIKNFYKGYFKKVTFGGKNFSEALYALCFISNLMVVPLPIDFDTWKKNQLQEIAERNGKQRDDPASFQEYGGRSLENRQARKERQIKREKYWNDLLKEGLIDCLFAKLL